ncbi:hypothetical protein LY78DRAFT_81895 [Colletotrichum sublineola]|nr:hypothetical protein LY78DRAFT_81895 [Colletotrichum sublineola]
MDNPPPGPPMASEGSTHKGNMTGRLVDPLGVPSFVSTALYVCKFPVLSMHRHQDGDLRAVFFFFFSYPGLLLVSPSLCICTPYFNKCTELTHPAPLRLALGSCPVPRPHPSSPLTAPALRQEGSPRSLLPYLSDNARFGGSGPNVIRTHGDRGVGAASVRNGEWRGQRVKTRNLSLEPDVSLQVIVASMLQARQSWSCAGRLTRKKAKGRGKKKKRKLKLKPTTLFPANGRMLPSKFTMCIDRCVQIPCPRGGTLRPPEGPPCIISTFVHCIRICRMYVPVLSTLNAQSGDIPRKI